MDFNYKKNFLYIHGQILNAYKRYSSEKLKSFGLAPIEIEILKFLINNGDTYRNSKDIVRFKGVSKALVSKGVTSLVANGYLDSLVNPKDKRTMDLYVTEKARPIVNSLLEINNDFRNILFQGLTPDDLEIFYRINNTFLKNLDSFKEV